MGQKANSCDIGRLKKAEEAKNIQPVYKNKAAEGGNVTQKNPPLSVYIPNVIKKKKTSKILHYRRSAHRKLFLNGGERKLEK